MLESGTMRPKTQIRVLFRSFVILWLDQARFKIATINNKRSRDRHHRHLRTRIDHSQQGIHQSEDLIISSIHSFDNTLA